MVYDLAKISITALLEPAFRAGIALTRLHERIARSPVGQGWIERSYFADACASLWIDGELVHLEDLVLHDATKDIRTPTHELTIARDVLRTRRRIAAQLPGWALSPDGIRTLRRNTSEITSVDADEAEAAGVTRRAVAADPEGDGDVADDIENLPGVDYAAIDAVLARSEAGIENATRPGPAAAARRKKIRSSMISTGTRIPGSMNGGAWCTRPKTCRGCCRRTSPSMPGTSFRSFSTPLGSAACLPPQSCEKLASPPAPIWPPSMSA